MSILIQNATILTQDKKRRQLNGNIFIEDNRIVEISPKPITTEAEYLIDASHHLVLPGLINGHTHIPMTLLRGYGDDMLLDDWLRKCIWPVEAKLTNQSVKIGTDLGLLEMIASGTTTYLDMYFYEQVIAEQTIKAGIRGLLGFALIDGGTPEFTSDNMLPACNHFIQTWKNHELIQPVVAPHGAYTCGPETLQKALDISRQHNVLMHIHCAETRENVYDIQKRYGMRPVAHLKKLGLLNPQASLAHCGWITKNEVKDIKKTGTSIVHCPVSNMKIATGGYTPLPECLDTGVPVSLGTDGAASNNCLDLFDTMKFCALIHKHHRWDPRILPAQTVLDFVTCEASHSFHLDKYIGSIEEGKKADMIILDIKKPHFVPYHDHVSNVVYTGRGSDVTTSIVNGVPVMLNNNFLTIDVAKTLDAAQRCSDELIK
jgi:5-methylthioadenosine/S-adenosylhomocysteine deaminase